MARESEIEIDDEEHLDGKVFRLLTRTGVACDRSLSVRFEWTDNGWVASFYRWQEDAMRDCNALTSIPQDDWRFVVRAMKMLSEMEIPTRLTKHRDE